MRKDRSEQFGSRAGKMFLRLFCFRSSGPKTLDVAVRNEKGIALVTVLILSLICLGIVATLIYLVVQGTKFSGFLKKYESSLDAGVGVAEITAELIQKRGSLPELKSYGLLANLSSKTSDLLASCDCGDPRVYTDTLPAGNCLCKKLCDPTVTWPIACGSSGTSYQNPSDIMDFADIQFTLPGIGATTYQVSAKIVDTTVGNSDLSGRNLGGTAVVATSGAIPVSPNPYLYTVEINAQDTASATERARLSVLYAY